MREITEAGRELKYDVSNATFKMVLRVAAKRPTLLRVSEKINILFNKYSREWAAPSLRARL